MKRILMPSFVVVAAACGGAPTPDENPPAPDTPISVNPPAPDGGPGIGDGAGPPPAIDDEPVEEASDDAESSDD